MQSLENDYVKNYFKVCKKRKLKLKIIAVIMFMITVLAFVLVYFNNIFNKIVYSYCESEISKILTDSANLSIGKVTKQVNYENLVNLKYDSTGNLTNIEANPEAINNISNQLALFTQKEIDNKSKIGIKIPIGTCSGITIFTGKGSDIIFNINPIGNVICNFYTIFESAGINQTSHKIYVKIESEMSLILPFSFNRIKKEVSFLISECIIIGKVPDTYLGMSDLLFNNNV